MLMKFYQVPVSKEDNIDHEKLRKKRGNEKPLRSWMKASEIFSASDVLESSIIELIVVELPFSGKCCSRHHVYHAVPSSPFTGQPPAGLISNLSSRSTTTTSSAIGASLP